MESSQVPDKQTDAFGVEEARKSAVYFEKMGLEHQSKAYNYRQVAEKHQSVSEDLRFDARNEEEKYVGGVVGMTAATMAMKAYCTDRGLSVANFMTDRGDFLSFLSQKLNVEIPNPTEVFKVQFETDAYDNKAAACGCVSRESLKRNGLYKPRIYKRIRKIEGDSKCSDKK